MRADVISLPVFTPAPAGQ